MSAVPIRAVIEGGGPTVRRRIVVWRRLEPGDVRSPGALATPESPFLEARLVELTLPAAFHARMTSLAEARARALTLPRTWTIEYEPAGVLIAGAGGALFGAWLEYLRPADVFFTGGAIAGVAGLVLAAVAKRRRAAAESEAAARWAAAPERHEHDDTARTLAEGWVKTAQELKRSLGVHTEIRVAEGSNDPLRLASIDPRPLIGGGAFDPEDWLPTEGGGVRYEAIHASGELVTRLLPGSTEVDEAAPRADDPRLEPTLPATDAAPASPPDARASAVGAATDDRSDDAHAPEAPSVRDDLASPDET